MPDLRHLAALAAPKLTTRVAARLPTIAPSSTAASLFTVSTTAGTPPPSTAAARLSSTEAAAFLLRSGLAALPSPSAAGTIAIAFFVTATAAATLAAAPQAATLACPPHSQVISCGILPTVTRPSHQETELVLPGVSKLRKQERSSAGAGVRETAAFFLNCTQGAFVTVSSHVTSASRKKEPGGNCRVTKTAAASRAIAAAKHHAGYTCAWRGESGKSVVKGPAPRAIVEIRRVSAASLCSVPVKYFCFVWKQVQHRATVFFSSTSPLRRVRNFIIYIPPRSLPCPVVPKSSRGHFHYFCSTDSRHACSEEALCQRCLSRVVGQFFPSSSFRFCLPLFAAGFRSCTEQQRWRGSCRPVSRLFPLNLFKLRRSSASSIFPRALLQPSLSRASVAPVRNAFNHLPDAYVNCSSGFQLGSRRLNSCSRLLCTTRPRLHSTCGSTCHDTDVDCKRTTVIYSTRGCSRYSRTCVINDSSATFDRGSARESNTISSGLGCAVSRGRSCSRPDIAGWNACYTSARSSCGEHAVSVRREKGTSFLGPTTAPSFAFFLNRRSGPVTSVRLYTTGKKTETSRRSWQLLTSTSRLSNRMEPSPASAVGTQDTGLEEVTLQLEAHEQELFDMLMQCVRDENLDIGKLVLASCARVWDVLRGGESCAKWRAILLDPLDIYSDPSMDVLRAAGGWVRDKLLHQRSDDIDIVIDKMTGVQFAGALNRWLVARGLPSHTVGVVASNPEQSKHLETATCRLLGRFHVDFVHLRTETYSQGSRIPQAVAFGLPKEDACRRDFTINALFYNVHTRKVEDFTGMGLQDLRSGLLRTPLPDAEATLLDDPLRILRAVRFASRFAFRLHPDLIWAAQVDTVRKALVSKVSRERIGIEVRKMLTGPSARRVVTNANEASDASFTEDPAEASLRNVKIVTTGHRDVNGGTSMPRSISKTRTANGEKLHNDAIGGEGGGADSGVVAFPTGQVTGEDEVFLKRISEAARSAREALFLLVRLRVVSSVFKLPDHVIVPPVPADDEHFSKRPAHEQQQLVPSERDSQLKEWWVDGLRCAYALTTWLEHYFEGFVGNTAETHEDENRRPKSAVDVQFSKLMEQGSVCFADFTNSHFRALVLGCFLFPMAGRFCMNDKSKREKLLNFLIVSSLKLSRKDAEQVVLLVEGAWAFLREIFNDTETRAERNEELMKSNAQGASQLPIRLDWTVKSQERARLGLLIRSIGPLWAQALLVAAAALQTVRGNPQADGALVRRGHLSGTADKGESLDHTPVDEAVSPFQRTKASKRMRLPSVEGVEHDGDFKEEENETATVAELAVQAACAPLREQRLELILLLQQKIKQAKIEEAWKLQPLYDGRAVKDVLAKLPKGPIFKEVQEEQVRWQLANPSKTREDCALHLRKTFKEFL